MTRHHSTTRLNSRQSNKLALTQLEDRVMLSTVDVFIAGQTNSENFNLIVDGSIVANIDNVGGNASSGDYVRYSFQTIDNPGNVRIEFTNDLSSPATGFDRNLRVREIVVDGAVFKADDANVFSTGTWRTSDGCAPGFKQSQWLTCNGYLNFDVGSAAGIPGQSGSLRIDSSWKTNQLDTNFEDPVVIVGPPSSGDLSPGVAQIQNVSSNRFDIRFKEWLYDDFNHDTESVDFLALESGTFRTEDGSIWEAGTFDLRGSDGFKFQRFASSFQRAPFLFLTIQTQNGRPAIVRVQNLSRGGFESRLFSEQAFNGLQGAETIGYLAIQPAAPSGVLDIGGQQTPYLLQQKQANHNVTELAGTEIFLQEERSVDGETSHSFEQVNGLALGGLTFAQATGTAGGDTFSIRKIDRGFQQVLPDGFVLEEIVSEVDTRFMVALEVDWRGDAYIADEKGIIWKVKNGNRLSVPFLDIRDRVSNVNADLGQMTGFALDPDYQNNGYLYVMYTTTVDGESFGRLERYNRAATNPDRVSLASRRILIGRTSADGLVAGKFHSQGDIEFGRDGSLLFSWGDSASNEATDPDHFNSQRLNVAAGKIFRVHAGSGRGMGTNPFFNGNPDAVQSKVWAFGLRNGFRFDVKPGTGSTTLNVGRPGLIVISDVGRDQFEELNVSYGGENFGWPYFEGTGTFRNGGQNVFARQPAFSIAHPEARSIIGGDFVTSNQWPSQYNGRYFAADFVEGWVRTYQIETNGAVTEFDFASGIKGITDMEYHAASGDLYLVGRGEFSFFPEGEGLSGLYRIRYVG